MPSGTLCLRPDMDEATPLALISAGAGVTPMMSMLESLQPRSGPVTFVQCCKSPDEHLFRASVDKLLGQLGDNAQGHVFYSSGIP